VITKQVIERHLVAPLAGILSPVVMARYTEEEIISISAEKEEFVEMRAQLQSKLRTLEEGDEAFSFATGHVFMES
jgi:hypothetical protein